MIGQMIKHRYLVESNLGRGGMGTVYRARDTVLERDVALKVLATGTLGTEGRARLLQEARAAAGLNHPNIVAVHDVVEATLPGQARPISFIVMELVGGRSLRDVGDLSPGAIVELASQMCSALEAAHSMGIIHRDLKPENVFVTDSQTLKLMDFGLARRSDGTRLTQEGTLMGTLAYLAPEIILGQPATIQSDLYALGVMLYELAARRPPFEGDSPTAVLSQHLYAPVAPPSTFNEEVPAGLDRLILKLLSKQPGDRPASASEVRQALDAVSEAGRQPAPALPPSRLDRLVRGRLIGRDQEFAEAAALWQRVSAGEGHVLMISGEPGIGKSRLVRELITLAEISGGQAFAAECFAEGIVPYLPVAEMVRQSLASERRPELAEDVMADLHSLAPDLRRTATDLADRQSLTADVAQLRLLESLVAWAQALADSAPLLLAFDDLHWADSGTAAALRHLARRTRHQPVLIVGTYREVDLATSRPFQQALNELSRQRLMVRLKLSRLGESQTKELLATLFAEEITPEFLTSIYRETEGNPFFVEEVCRALVESGELYYADGRWHRPSIDELRIPQGVQVTIQSRLDRLTESTSQTLQWAALLGRDFEYDLLAAVRAGDNGGGDEEGLIADLEEAEQAQLIEELHPVGRSATSVASPRFSFSHALIHSTLLSELSTLRRQRMQRQVALTLEDAFPDRVAELAPLLGRYFAEAGEAVKAQNYLLQTGDAAASIYAYDEAVVAYEQALLFLRDSGNSELAARTLMKLGLAYHNNFAFDKSHRAYEEAFALRRGSAATMGGAAVSPAAPHSLRVQSRAPTTLDPSRTGDTFSGEIIPQLFSALVEMSPDGQLLPDVAHSWAVLEGGRRYVFRLREDVSWSDGRPVTASDFVAGWRRALAPGVDWRISSTFFDIHHAQAYHEGELDDPDLVGVRAPDEGTLIVELDEPIGYFLQLMATAPAFPVPRHAVERWGEAWTEVEHIVTNGPFQLTGHRPGESLTLRRSPKYHGRFHGNVEELVMSFAQQEPAWQAYLSGQMDVLMLLHYSPAEQVRMRQQRPADYLQGPKTATAYLGFQLESPPLDDVRVRRALVLAIDREYVANVPFAGLYAPVTGGFVPPAVPGHVPGLVYDHDPDEARSILASAGYPDGRGFPRLTFLQSGQLSQTAAADVVRLWKQELGIDVDLRSVPFASLMQAAGKLPGDLWLMGWTADYQDPDNFLRVAQWHQWASWHNPEYDSLIEDARHVRDQSRRLAMYHQAQEILHDELPVTPIAYGYYSVLAQSWVRHLQLGVVNWVAWKHVILDPHP